MAFKELLKALPWPVRQVEYDLTRSFGDFGPAKSYQELSEAYLFLDWFAIPQVTAAEQQARLEISLTH